MTFREKKIMDTGTAMSCQESDGAFRTYWPSHTSQVDYAPDEGQMAPDETEEHPDAES